MRIEITIAVDFDDATVNGDPIDTLSENMERAVGNGVLTGDTELIVDSWSASYRRVA